MTEKLAGAQDDIHWPSLIAAISSISAVGIAIGLGLPLLSLILENRGIPSSLSGLNTATAGIAAMMAAPVTTKLAHRFGVATTMIWAVVIAAISSLGFFYIENFWAWFPLRIVFHGATTTLFILSEFWINFAAPPGKRGLVLGIYATVLSVGFALGTLIFSAVGTQGFLPFAVGSTIILFAVIPIYLARGESPYLVEKPQHHFLRYTLAVPTAIIGVFVFGAVQAGGLALFPVYATRLGFTESQAGVLLTTMAVGNVIFQIPLGLISDRMKDRRKLLAAMGAIGLVGALLLPYAAMAWSSLALLLLLWGGVVAGLYTVGLSHIGHRFMGADLAAANAAFIFFYAIGTVAGPAAIGAGMDIGGADGFTWMLTAFFGVFVAFALYRLIFHPQRT
ncbi:MFS transporter [Rhizobium sp. KVB221]|uniref:MFS transporter n=1 Tax=Rhizobium setariae TaxID=2801340 RepID=A0A936YTU1_9HYPH|nr:MFS transporter [Rhizobium setariae]MBL0374837.1 MFS transporter [Rhizobium setariae]